MRPLSHGDVARAARVLIGMPEAAHEAALALMFEQVETADAYRRERGRPHPRWGDGSLGAVALRWPIRPEPPLEDLGYARALARVFEAVVAHRAGLSPGCSSGTSAPSDRG